MSTRIDIESELAQVFADAGCEGFLHARAVDGEGELSYRATEPVVLASVFKVPVLLEFARAVANGELEPTERIVVPAKGRTLGPTGLSVMLDDVELSLRDLAYLMMSVSDNAATDALMQRLGCARINALLAELGLAGTFLEGDCANIFSSFPSDVGIELGSGVGLSDIDPAALSRWRALDPRRTNRSTPEEVTSLLAAVWRDEAGPAAACAEVRRILGHQVWPHRLTAGFPSGVKLAAKTGTLPGIRNEAGVVTYPDGGKYAVAVFTVSSDFTERQPRIDAAIGISAHLAVEQLRAG